MKNFILGSLLLFSFIPGVSAQITISAAHAQPIGAVVTVTGVVTNGNELGTIRYIQDPTAGMAIYSSTLATVNRGDSITVTGTLSNYNNLLEMDPVSVLAPNSTGNALPALQVVNPSLFDETLESELVRIDNAVFAAGGSAFAGNTNYVFNSAGFAGQIRILTGSSLVGRQIPIGAVTVIGILSQYCTAPATGCTSGYQLLPRDTNDLIIPAGIHIVSQVTQSNINTTTFDVNWLTDSTGSSYVKYGLTPNLELGIMTGAGATTSHVVSLTGLIPSQIYYVQAFSVNASDTARSGINIFAARSLSSGNIKVYFNTLVNDSLSTGTNATSLINAIDDTLIAYINRAKYTLDMTIYDFGNTGISSIATAINNAHNRGVRVRFISDGNEAGFNGGLSVLSPSIPQILSPVGGIYTIMHNKFVVVDAKSSDPMDPLVWTGSTNWTDGQINHDANNVIIIQDQSLARAYTLEFEEMWGDTGSVAVPANSKFGPDKTDNTPHEFIINGKRVESYFSPSDGTNAQILKAINSANSEIDFASMIITRSDISDAITAKVSAGVHAYGIVDDQSATTQWSALLSGMDGASHMHDWAPSYIMHNKFLIIDQDNTSSDPIVLTGSHNWSSSADQKNDENTLLVHDATIANIYYQAFYYLFTGDAGPGSGIQDASSIDHTISVYPSPAENVLHFVSDSKCTKACIYNLLGEKTAEFNVNAETFTIPVAGYSPGIYILQVMSGEQNYRVKWVKR